MSGVTDTCWCVMVYLNTEIHVFGDASKSAYGAVLYLVTPPGVNCEKGEVKLLMAKAKLTPPIKSQNPKEDTIPHWELASLVLAGHLVQFIKKDIAELAHCPVYIWGDNRAALSWCTSDKIEDIYIFR